MPAQYEEADEQFQRTLELDPRFSYGQLGHALVLVQVGRHKEATAIVREVNARSTQNSFSTAIAAFVLGRSGQTSEARGLTDSLTATSEQGYVPASRLALAQLGSGNNELAMQSLETAAEERSRFVIFLGVWPAFDRVREFPRLRALIDKIGMQTF